MAKHGYEQTSVEEIREKLRKDFGMEDEDLKNNTKGVLVEMLVQAEVDKEAVGVLIDVEDEDDFTSIPISEENPKMERPVFNSDSWHEWVMLQFSEDELEGGAPVCDGLRRITENILGPISKVEVIKNTSPNLNNSGNATVTVGVTIDPITLEDHPLFGRIAYVEDIADANRNNTPSEIFKHPSATAASRAEARVYRKLLRMKKQLAAEELQAEGVIAEDLWTPASPIKDEQINTLDLICKRTDMSVIDFINIGDNKYISINQINDTIAARMLQHANRVQRKDIPRPDNVGKYDPNWRKEDVSD
jgi:hypothetical protein